jgi:hypothetical protein
LKMGVGGVGFYPTSGSPFVHLDTGNVRHWPKMSRQELARIFPDGKTLHVPSDGKPLPKYDQALAEYKAKGRTSPVTVASAEETKKPGFFARLAAKAQEDQADDEGANDPVPGVETRKSAPVLTAAATPNVSPAAELLEGRVDVPAPPKVAAGRTPVPAAEVGAKPANVPLPQDPQQIDDPASGQPFEVAAAEAPPAEDGSIPFDRVPVPERRPQAPVLAFAAATPQQRPADNPGEAQVVAALTPDEIENLRRTAVPNPATAEVAMPQLALVQSPSATAGAEKAVTQIAQVASAKPAVAPAPAANTVSTTASTAKPREQSVIAVAASQASGPSRKTLELALASTSDNDSEATRAIRDLIDAAGNSATPIADASAASASTGAVPVPQRDPRAAKVAGSKSKANTAPQNVAATAASTEKVGRYALASAANIGAVKEISAPGYAVGTQDSQLVVATFGMSLSQPVTGKFAPQTVAKLPALTVRTN